MRWWIHFQLRCDSWSHCVSFVLIRPSPVMGTTEHSSVSLSGRAHFRVALIDFFSSFWILTQLSSLKEILASRRTKNQRKRKALLRSAVVQDVSSLFKISSLWGPLTKIGMIPFSTFMRKTHSNVFYVFNLPCSCHLWTSKPLTSPKTTTVNMHYGQNGGLKSWKYDAGELKGAQAPQHVGNSWKNANSL